MRVYILNRMSPVEFFGFHDDCRDFDTYRDLERRRFKNVRRSGTQRIMVL